MSEYPNIVTSSSSSSSFNNETPADLSKKGIQNLSVSPCLEKSSSLQGGDGGGGSNSSSNSNSNSSYDDSTLNSNSKNQCCKDDCENNQDINDILKNLKFPKYEFCLQDQQLLKEESTQYICDICGFRYAHNFSLKRHYLRKHINYVYLNQNDITNCSISANNLNLHFIKYKNLLQKDHKNICDIISSFQTKDKNCIFSYLFCCNECTEMFNDKAALKEHLINHEMKTKARSNSNKRKCSDLPYQCFKCQKYFNDIESLKKHEETHKFSCNCCNSVFLQKKDLKQHLSEKHSEFAHLCFVCCEVFSAQSKLQEHLKKHRIEDSENQPHNEKSLKNTKNKTKLDKDKPFQSSKGSDGYQCTLCAKSFATYGNLSRHQRQVHPVPTSYSRRRNKNVVTEDGIDAKFYNSVANNIADNLVHHVDGKASHVIETAKSLNLGCFEEIKINFPWKDYNFPSDFDLCNNDQPSPLKYTQSSIEEEISSEINKQIVKEFISKDEIDPTRDKEVLFIYKCKVCDASFNSLRTVHEHYVNNHNGISSNIECGYEYEYPPPQVYHIISTPVGAYYKYIKTPFKSQENCQLMTCTKCKAAFSSTSDLHSHILECGSKVLKDRNQRVDNDNLIRRPENASSVPEYNLEQSCDTCHRVFSHSVTLERHKRSCASKHGLLSKLYKENSDLINNNKRKRNQHLNRVHQLVLGPKYTRNLKMVEKKKMNSPVETRKQKRISARLKSKSPSDHEATFDDDNSTTKSENKENITKRNATSKRDSLQPQHWCSYCRRSFVYLANFRKHMVDGCPIKKQLDENQNLNENGESSNTDRETKLSMRGQIEQSMIGLLSNQSLQSEIIGTSDRTTPTKHFQTFSCTHCHKIFFCLFNMLKHQVSHKLHPEDCTEQTECLDQATKSETSDSQNDLCETLEFNNNSNELKCELSKEETASPLVLENAVPSPQIVEFKQEENLDNAQQSEQCLLKIDSSEQEIDKSPVDCVTSLDNSTAKLEVPQKKEKVVNDDFLSQPGPSRTRKRKAAEPVAASSRTLRVSRKKTQATQQDNIKKETSPRTYKKRAKKQVPEKVSSPKKTPYKSRSERSRKITTPKKYKQ
ncbi:zinc finger protein 43-like isoform X2 [Centruroides sculpturatus]|nr:zinc finger protein 43-like isoform X2 [Centruroides sculpturatus]XP_023225119.1 zinc finger protein 43-like isoform X2 [Centruroides sculpturatus]